MKLSVLIKQLEDRLAEHGDAETGIFVGSKMCDILLVDFIFYNPDNTKDVFISIDKNDEKEIEMY